jgi:expansin (peptidoglycan-binding protein)
MKLEFEGSHSFYLKVQVQNHRYGIASVETKDAGEAAWTEMIRTFDNHFERISGGPFDGPLAFRITDLHGQTVEAAPVATPIANGTPYESGVQLAVVCPEPAGALAVATALVAALRAARRRS